MDSKDRIILEPIGIIRTPFNDPKGMPIQPVGARGVIGSIEIKKEFQAGLKDLDGFSHVILLYLLHLVEGYSLEVKPFLDTSERGIFSTRSPKRPNRIGLSVVRLVSVEEGIVTIENIDVIDGTPLLDIKPYVPEFDHVEAERTGWLTDSAGNALSLKSDDRFK